MSKFLRNVKKKLHFTSRKGEYDASKYEREIDKRLEKLKSISIQSLSEAVVFEDFGFIPGTNTPSYYLEPTRYARCSLPNDFVAEIPQVVYKQKFYPPPSIANDGNEIDQTSDDNLSFRSCFPPSDVDSYYQHEPLLEARSEQPQMEIITPRDTYSFANEQSQLIEKKKKYSINQEISKYNTNLHNLIDDMKNFDDYETCEEFYYSEGELYQSINSNNNNNTFDDDLDEDLYEYIEHLGEPEERDFEKEEAISHELLNYLDYCANRSNNTEQNIYEEPQTESNCFETKINQNKSLVQYPENENKRETKTVCANEKIFLFKQTLPTESFNRKENDAEEMLKPVYLKENVEETEFHVNTSTLKQIPQSDEREKFKSIINDSNQTQKEEYINKDLKVLQQSTNELKQMPLGSTLNETPPNENNIDELKQTRSSDSLNEFKQNSRVKNMYENNIKQMTDDLKQMTDDLKQMPNMQAEQNSNVYRDLKLFNQMLDSERCSLNQNVGSNQTHLKQTETETLDHQSIVNSKRIYDLKEFNGTLETDNYKNEFKQMPINESFYWKQNRYEGELERQNEEIVQAEANMMNENKKRAYNFNTNRHTNKFEQVAQIEEYCDLTETDEYEDYNTKPVEVLYGNSLIFDKTEAHPNNNYVYSDETNDKSSIDDSADEKIYLNIPISKTTYSDSIVTFENTPKTQLKATRFSLSTQHRLKTENKNQKSPIAAPRHFQIKDDDENVNETINESLEKMNAIKETVSQVRSKINESEASKTELLPVLMKQMRQMKELDCLELDADLLGVQEKVLNDIQECISELTTKQ